MKPSDFSTSTELGSMVRQSRLLPFQPPRAAKSSHDATAAISTATIATVAGSFWQSPPQLPPRELSTTCRQQGRTVLHNLWLKQRQEPQQKGGTTSMSDKSSGVDILAASSTLHGAMGLMSSSFRDRFVGGFHGCLGSPWVLLVDTGSVHALTMLALSLRDPTVIRLVNLG